MLAKRQSDVFGNGHGVEQGPSLEGDAERLAVGSEFGGGRAAEIHAPDVDMAATRLLQADKNAEERALAGTGTAEDDKGFPAADIEVDAVEDLPIAKLHTKIADGDDRFGLEVRCGVAGRNLLVHFHA